MPSASVTIAEAATSPNARLYFGAVLKSASGEALAGKEVRFYLEGDGSFVTTFSSKEVVRETDETGAAMITWYRRSIYGRDVKATLSAACEDADGTLELMPVDPSQVDLGPSITWTPSRRKF